MTQGNGVLFIGSIMVDVICPVPRLPQSGQGVVAQGVTSMLGGCAFNSANIARQLSAAQAAAESAARGGASVAADAATAAPAVRLFAPVGQGPYGAFVAEELAARGMAAFSPDDEASRGVDTGAAVCLIEPDGERTMLTLPGIERQFVPQWFEALEAQVDLHAFGSVNICGYEVGGAGGEAMIDFLEAHPELQLWFAPGPSLLNIQPERIARINALRPIWHLNEAEVTAFTGLADLLEAGRALCAQCGNAVVVTAGPDGSFAFLPDRVEPIHVPTTPIRPVDTIGAGDSHLGTCMTARAAGLCWEEALALANRVSGAVCGVAGAGLTDDQFAALGLRLTK